MLTLAFSAYDLSFLRFAFSPLREVAASIHALRTPASRALHLPWFKQVRPQLGCELGPLLDLITGAGYIPDFLCPVPTGPAPDLAGELAVLRATPHEVIRADLDRMASELGPLTGCAAQLHQDPAAGLERLVLAIETYWQLAFAPHWPRMRNLLEGDLLYRTRQYAEHGPAGVFADMHSAIRWEGRDLHLEQRPEEMSRVLAGEGLLLAASIFVWPGLFYRTDSPGQPIITYPVRAIATLWSAAPRPRPTRWPPSSAAPEPCCSTNWTHRPPPLTWPAVPACRPRTSPSSSRCCCRPAWSPSIASGGSCSTYARPAPMP